MRAALLAIALLLAGCTGAVDLGRAIERLQPSSAPSAVSADDAAIAAVKEVIERANAAQARAFATGDASLMRDTATAGYYDELRQINSDLARSGVTEFSLVAIEWGAIFVSGSTATATAYETWRTSYADGSQDRRTDRNDYTLTLENGAWKVDSDVHPNAQSVAPAPARPDTTTTTPAQISDTSANWSGYVATGGTFTSVTGTWTVPQVSTTTSGADATWVGIGGVSGNDLIQAGTMATVSGFGGVTYEAWIEMLPAPARTVSLGVSPGDSVTVTITEQSPGEWLIVIENNTTGSEYRQTVRYDSARSSAEWIQEAPSTGRGILPLDDFGTVRFSGASAVRDGRALDLAALGAKAVAMANRAGQIIAQPSALGADGGSFAVTRTSAPGTVQGGGRTFRRRG